jgi:murein DD-endopeptidase MepM/ murein hydrolase activator NlpD
VHFEVAKNKRSINPVRYLYKKSWQPRAFIGD